MRLIALLAPLCLLVAAPCDAFGKTANSAAGQSNVGPGRAAPARGHAQRTVRRPHGSTGLAVTIPSLPRQSPAEVQTQELNRSMLLQGQQREIQQQNRFEIDQLRYKLDQLR